MTKAGIRTPWAEPPAEGAATEVAPGVLWIRMPLPMALDHVNCFALDDGDGWTLVDTGVNSSRSRAIWQGVMAGPLKGRPVTRLVVTHHHPDHVGLAGWFQTEHGAELLMSRVAWLMARMLVLDEEERATPEAVAFWRASGMRADIFEKRVAERPFNFADIVARMPAGYTRLEDGGRIRMGGRDWDIRFGHGHAPHHATFWSRDDDLVLGGDQLLATISPNLGVFPTEPLADPVAEWLESCHRLAEFARPEQLVLPGHKLPYRGLPFRMTQLITNHDHALDRLRAHLATAPATAGGCFPPLFKREIGEREYGLALVEAVAHLNHLLHLGEVTRDLNDDGAWVWRLNAD